MSYDLFFSRRDGGPLSLRDFSAFFRGRARWELKEHQAWYSNEDTGVYFSFDYEGASERIEDERPASDVAFNMNFFRPPFFALEAAPEIATFVSHFDLLVHDPQVQGMGEGEYSEEGFLRGWNAGNYFGHRIIANQQQEKERLHSYPESRLFEAWKWNHQRERIQNAMHEDVFVPRIMFFEIDGAAMSAVVWGDAIPILIPEVDVVLIARQQLAPRRLFRRRPDAAAIPIGELSALLNAFPVSDQPLRHRRVIYDRPPEEIVQFVRSLEPDTAAIKGLPIDQVLSSELLAEARSEGAPEGVTFDSPQGDA